MSEIKKGSKAYYEMLSIRLGEVKAQRKALEDEEKEIKGEFWGYFDKTDTQYFEDGLGYYVARNLRQSVSLDPLALEEKVGPEEWKKITVVRREVDNDKLRRELEAGNIAPGLIKEATKVTQSFALLRNKVKKDEDPKTATVSDSVKSLIEGII